MRHVSPLDAQSDFFHEILVEWLQDPDITIVCGRWADGAISEFMPGGRARLLPARYEGCFAGVRELRLENAPHHLHVDLGRVHQACYTVAPSVCLDFKPSFELRFLTLGPGGAPSDRWALSVMLTQPYDGRGLRQLPVERFFRRAQAQACRQPGWVDIRVETEARGGEEGARLLDLLRSLTSCPGGDWDAVLSALRPAGPAPVAETISPPCLPLLEQALALPDASLVIYRDRTLVEFQTGKLGGVHRYAEQGHVSWQIGRTEEHHCHLSLGAVERVLFSAEPVSCQGGGLNYTIWFLTPGPAGNPWRRDGYFSITLNRPYRGERPRLEVIEPMLDLYRRFRAQPWVEADDTFMQVVGQGAPSRRTPQKAAIHA